MVQTQQPTQTNNMVTNGYLLTTQVNPASIPQDQKKNDLDVLKSAEDFMTGKSDTAKLSSPLNMPRGVVPAQPTTSVVTNLPQELIALRLKNPFRGE